MSFVTSTYAEAAQGGGARRYFPVEKKLAMIEEARQPGNTLSSVARKYGIAPAQLYQWRRAMDEGSKKAVEANEEVVSMSEHKKALQRIRELERQLGKKTMQVEILKEGLELAKEKKLISRIPSLPEDDSK